jgi:predicted nucleic acid-binding protein
LRDLVIDNSAAINIARSSAIEMPSGQYFAPDVIDLEFAYVIRKLVLRGALSTNAATEQIYSWATNDLIRCPHTALLPRIWQLRDNITPYDAAYVALAEHLGLPLVTADHRLAKSASQYCEVLTVGTASA